MEYVFFADVTPHTYDYTLAYRTLVHNPTCYDYDDDLLARDDDDLLSYYNFSEAFATTQRHPQLRRYSCGYSIRGAIVRSSKNGLQKTKNLWVS